MNIGCCSICGNTDDLECPACDQPFCISCFVDHGKKCYEESKKKAEQGKQEKTCAHCKTREASSSTCATCQKHVCAACFYNREGCPETEKKKQSTYYSSPYGRSPFEDFKINIDTEQLDEMLKNMQDTIYKAYGNPQGAAQQAKTEEEHLRKEQEAKQKQQEKTCAKCSADEFNDLFQCTACLQWFCEMHSQECNHCKQMFCWEHHAQHVQDQNRKAREEARQQEARAQREKAEQKANDQWEQMKRANDAFWQDMFKGQSFYWGDDSYTFRQRYTGQQSYTTGSGVSQELVAAFSVLQLSTRATVQEVKRAFRRKAKEAHPDTGGSEQVFKALNAAYQLALAHAERNER